MTTNLTKDQIRELSEMVTRDDSGRHFTEWSRHYETLEKLGLIEVFRPAHEQTGISYDCRSWSVEVTDAGRSVLVDEGLSV